ncbi:hypothetical protein GO001_34800 [Streptomyces sp. NRRL B-1677]|uniref:hypothetical protein n=1 Tax=Streptomyces sp. NRRL B-1677 TaxID=2682966 RepID=UPI001892D185|nr:hypothetical protein [Streptomyces sp. NRRL B-1677]MBF6050279.1 hypothetical protein [Streptomyces sp. NRRL B-1677]
MTSNETETTAGATDKMLRIQAQISEPELSATAVATRDKLLEAIGREAQLVAEKSAGQASTALAELAHAYALATRRQHTIYAENVLHDFGALSITSSDALAMGRTGEMVMR